MIMTHLCDTCNFYRYTEWKGDDRTTFRLFFCLFYKRQIAKYSYRRTYDAEEENYFTDTETVFRNDVETCRRYDRRVVKLHHFLGEYYVRIPYGEIGKYV